MKKTTKILSVFMALLLVFSCIPMTAFAAGRDTTSLSNYLDNKNLANVAETLLTDLGDRKEELVPTVLNLCFQLINDLKKTAEADGVDVMKADTETLAKELIVYVNKVLEEANLNEEVEKPILGDYSIAYVVKSLTGMVLDLSSVDSILQLLVDAGKLINKPTGVAAALGDFGKVANLDVSMLIKEETKTKTVAMSTTNSSALDIIYALFDFLSADANVTIIKDVIAGKLDLGKANDRIKTFAKKDIEAMVNDKMKNLDVTINEQIYNGLLAEKEIETDKDGNETEVIKVEFEKSDYADFNSDELLAAALLKLISGKDATKAEAAATAKMTIYELIGTYADAVIASFLIEPLNTTVKDALKDLIGSDPQLAVLNDIINLDYEFKADTFNFAELAEDGLFENLNNMVCKIIEVIAQPAVYAELGLKMGGNENITANLTSFFGFVLKTLAGNNGGKLEFTIDGTKYSYDFSGFTAENLKDKSLEDMVVAVLGLFYPTWFGSSVPADVDNLEKLAVYTAYLAIDKFMVKDAKVDFDRDYKDLVFNADGTVKALTYDETADAIGTMGMDVAIYWLNRATNIGIDQAKATELKAAGWTWEDFFEEIVDWALNYIDGIPAVADVLDTNQGEIDEFCNTAWYKLNVVLNEMIPLGFVNGCGDATFTFDIRTFILDKAVPSVLDCDFAAFADILSMNKNENNPFNKSVISSAVDFIDNLLFSLFEHNCGETATAEVDGYKVTYDTANGHYLSVEKLPDEKPTEPEEKPTEPEEKPTEPEEKPTEPEEKPTEPEEKPTDPTPATVKGDVDGDGKTTAVDARLTLRYAASLEVFTDEQIAAADVDGTPGVTAMDARLILRVAAGLDVFPA